MNALGDQWDCHVTVSGDGPGVQQDCICVCVEALNTARFKQQKTPQN